MTSKISFSKLLKENLRRRPGMIALTTLYFLFTIIMFIIAIQNTMAFEGWTRKEVYDQILVSIGFSDMSVLCALLGVIVGVSGFAWMHSGKKSDFYYALPVRRRELFRVITAGSILVFGALLLVSSLIRLAITAALGYCTPMVFANLLLGLICYLATYVSAFLTAALAMTMTGHIVVGILGTGVFLTWAPVLCKYMITNFQRIFFQTFVSPSRILDILDYGSPTYLLVLYGNDKSGMYTLESVAAGKIPWSMILHGAVICLWIAALFILCRKIFEIRPAEAAGNAMAFPKINPVIRVLLVIPMASFVGYYMYSLTLSTSKLWVFFGVALGAVLIHGIIECIFQFDVHGLWSHRKQMLATAFVALCLTATFYLDLYGYDTYVPKAEQTDSVMLEETHFNGRLDYFWGESEHGVSGEDKESILTVLREALSDSADDAAAGTSDATVEEVSQGEADGVSQFYSIYNGMNMSDNPNQKFLLVTYYMKDGRQIRRNYSMDTAKVNQVLDQAFQMESYRKSLYALYTADWDAIEEITWSDQLNTQSMTLTEGEKEELLRTYLSELDTLTYEQMRTTVPTGELAVRHDTGNYNTPSEDYYYIYPTFTKTLAFLEKKGCPVHESLADMNITQIDVCDYRGKESEDWTVTDPELIRQVKTHLKPAVTGYSIDATGYEGSDYLLYDITVSFYDRYGETVITVVTDEEGMRLLESGAAPAEQAAE